VAGAFAGILEHTVMFPVDSIKTRMQILKSSTTTSAVKSEISNSVFENVYHISKTEGPLSLWRGITSVVLGAGPAHAVYFGTYEYVKKQLIINHKDSNVLEIGVAGSAATITSEALMNPFDVIKQRMQIHKGNKLNVFNVIGDIYKNEGFKSFYYSYPTTIMMTIPFTALNFIVYESSIKLINPGGEHDPLKHCISGGFAGGVASALTTPLDVIKTFLQTNGVKLKVTKFRHATKLVWQSEGFKGFWKGLKPRVISNVPSTAICWTAYEMAKFYLT
jgi:solute carrier family 25 iron transporter 28/37